MQADKSCSLWCWLCWLCMTRFRWQISVSCAIVESIWTRNFSPVVMCVTSFVLWCFFMGPFPDQLSKHSQISVAYFWYSIPNVGGCFVFLCKCYWLSPSIFRFIILSDINVCVCVCVCVCVTHREGFEFISHGNARKLYFYNGINQLWKCTFRVDEYFVPLSDLYIYIKIKLKYIQCTAYLGVQ